MVPVRTGTQLRKRKTMEQNGGTVYGVLTGNKRDNNFQNRQKSLTVSRTQSGLKRLHNQHICKFYPIIS